MYLFGYSLDFVYNGYKRREWDVIKVGNEVDVGRKFYWWYSCGFDEMEGRRGNFVGK